MGVFRFKLPDIGEGVVEAEITAWHVALGESVEEDQPIADAMTDKATIELTSPVEGVIKTLACEAGEMLAVGADLAVFEIEGGEDEAEAEVEDAENAPHPVSETQAEGEAEITPLATMIAPQAKPSPAPTKDRRPAEKRRTTDKVLASPAVRRRAESLALDLADIPFEGERVEHADLDAFLTKGNQLKAVTQKQPAKPDADKPSKSDEAQNVVPEDGETRIKVIGLRRVIAQRMSEAKRHIPHFTYVEEMDVSELEALRARTNAKKADNKPKLTVLPLLIRAIAITLKDWPQFNARYFDEQGYVSQYQDVNLGIATQTDLGLVVPVLKKAGDMSLWHMAAEITRLSEAARSNGLTPEELQGATTTLTSLGPLGGVVTTPVINRPEVAIFGPNKIRTKLVLEDGKPIERKVMNFSISCDHRVIDGYDAAAMMQDLRKLIEDPRRIFLL